MKYSMKYVLAITTIVLILISGYQLYWLVNIYHTLDSALERNLKEAVRAADFEEIVHRVVKMQEENVGGEMSITVGADPKEEKTILKNESKRVRNTDEKETNLDTNLPTPNFADALKDADDVMNVGLSMQSGIHSGLDKMRALDFKFYDRALSHRLDSLGVSVPHLSLYLQRDISDKLKCDTLARIGSITNEVDTFRLDLDMTQGTEYMVLVPKRNYAVIKQMKAPLIYSFVTLLMLLLAFAYIINIIKKMKALDEMKSDFTNNITHELKTPIAVSYAAIDALLNFNGADNPERKKKYLTICQEQLNLLTELVEQILSLSMERRKEMLLNIEEIEVLPIVERLTNMQKIKSKETVFDINIPESLTVKADKMHFSNIVSNLIDNAIKYSDSAPHITITAQQTGEGVDISVADCGIGISKESQHYIFDKFYRVPHGNLHNVKGYGLGLFYVKSMMTKFGGNISVNSELGKGSTFKLHFNG